MIDERPLYERFAAGDPTAFETLFARHRDAVYAWVYRIVRDRSEAEELTVDAFWRIYRARARFDPDRSFGAWARRIATNAALKALRSRGRRMPLPFEPAAPRTADPIERQDLRAAVASALAELSPELRLVATLALIEGVPHEEIARALGISRQAVKGRVFRATRKLRATLEARGLRP